MLLWVINVLEGEIPLHLQLIQFHAKIYIYGHIYDCLLLD